MEKMRDHTDSRISSSSVNLTPFPYVSLFINLLCKITLIVIVDLHFFVCTLPHSDHINCSACRYKFPRSILLPTLGTQLFYFYRCSAGGVSSWTSQSNCRCRSQIHRDARRSGHQFNVPHRATRRILQIQHSRRAQ